MSGPRSEFTDAFMQLRMHMIGMLAAINTDTDQGCEEEAVRIYRRICERDSAVRGNRPDDAVITWADLRLMAAGTFRVLLEELEAAR